MPVPIPAPAAHMAPRPATPPPVAMCRAGRLRLTLDGRDGDFNGMSHSGTALSIRNRGGDCILPALPLVRLRDARGRVLPALRQTHPGPAIPPVRLAGGHRAEAGLRWVSGPVFPASRTIRAASITVSIGGTVLRAPLRAILYGEAGKPVTFDQTPLSVVAGIAAD